MPKEQSAGRKKLNLCLHAQSQQQKHENKVQHLLKANNKANEKANYYDIYSLLYFRTITYIIFFIVCIFVLQAF